MTIVLGLIGFVILINGMQRLKQTPQVVKMIKQRHFMVNHYLRHKYVKIAFATIIFSKQHIS